MFIFYKVYSHAPSATLISALGGMLMTAGVLIAIGLLSGGNAGGILVGIILGGLGYLLRKLADKQAVRVWIKKGIDF